MKANNNLTWRKATVKDYDNVLSQWWKDWDWPIVPTLGMLSDGYIVSKDGIDIYAGFIFYTGTTIGWIEFIVSNKKTTPEQKRGGFEKLIDVISVIAKDKGVSILFTSTNDKPFINSLKKTGFDKGDEGVTQLTKQL